MISRHCNIIFNGTLLWSLYLRLLDIHIISTQWNLASDSIQYDILDSSIHTICVDLFCFCSWCFHEIFNDSILLIQYDFFSLFSFNLLFQSFRLFFFYSRWLHHFSMLWVNNGEYIHIYFCDICLFTSIFVELCNFYS